MAVRLPSTLLTLGLVFLAILLTPIISRRVGLPVIVLEVLAGIVLGKSLLNLVSYTPWLAFLADFGLIYLFFLVGLEMGIRRPHMEGVLIGLSSLALPFVLGYLLGMAIGIEPLLMGTLLCTTSMGEVALVLRETGVKGKLRHVTLEAAILADSSAMFLLAVSLEVVEGTPLSLTVLSMLFVLALFLIPVAIREFRLGRRLVAWLKNKSRFEYEVRFCIALIVTLALMFEAFGFHTVLGAFLAGLIVSELTERGSLLEKKLTGFGYGFFIPLFFIAVGVETNVRQLLSVESMAILALLLATGITSKVVGVSGVCRLLGFSKSESLATGFLHSARLSLIIAGARIGLELGLLTELIYSAIVIFSMITVLVNPSIYKLLMRKKSIGRRRRSSSRTST